LISELKDLAENGIQLFGETIYFIFAGFIGDNLGMNSILGFVESFSANHCCRFCKISKSHLKKATKEDKNLLRTRENYSSDLETNLSLTGIKEQSAFNSIPGFHVAENY